MVVGKTHQLNDEEITEGAEMSTMTIELPKALTEAIQDQAISLEELQAVIVKAVEDWLQSRPDLLSRHGQSAGSARFGASAVPFADKLIAENRRLFERLAQL